MTKRKTKEAPTDPPIVAEDLRIGGRPLLICPACDGFGGVPHGDVWQTCQACKGGGRVLADQEAEHVR